MALMVYPTMDPRRAPAGSGDALSRRSARCSVAATRSTTRHTASSIAKAARLRPAPRRAMPHARNPSPAMEKSAASMVQIATMSTTTRLVSMSMVRAYGRSRGLATRGRRGDSPRSAGTVPDSLRAVDAPGHMQRRAPMAAQQAVRALRQPPPDLGVQPLPLPRLHGDVGREGLEQVDVALGGVAHLPVELDDRHRVEEA